MKTSALLPILRSQLQGELLALLYLHPESEYSLTEAAAQIGASVRAVHHEVGRLADAGLVQDHRRGNMRLVRAADTRLSRPLTELLALTYGPLPVLAQELSSVAGIDEAYVFGSWARRFTGEPGPPPADVDALVIGTADLDDLDDAARHAEKTLLRPVNVTRVLPHQWADPAQDDGFLADVRGKARVSIEWGPRRGAGSNSASSSMETGERSEPMSAVAVDSAAVCGMPVSRSMTDQELQAVLPVQLDELRRVLRAQHVTSAYLFGSRSRGVHRRDSDIDLLCVLSPEHRTLDALVALQDAADALSPVKVDIATDINPAFKKTVARDLTKVM
ncbi:nucleotidyltransferase domain-containing protein [Mycolicibacterium austroafricanum]|uniref:nucleotidyltransferase domain-containing protein n=1 Tax=Mycolicibacterium austroafricanum TaxID=39687 RepID=UPI000A04E366|nr:nucleotidyltransferase domain-containing protein [Mycolicibacterium austroafricanum]